MAKKKSIFIPLFGRFDTRFTPALAAAFEERGYNLIPVTEIDLRAFALEHYDGLEVAHFSPGDHDASEQTVEVARNISPYLTWSHRLYRDLLRFHIGKFHSWIRKQFDRHSPVLVLLWNGSLSLNQVITRRMAEELGVPVCYMEMGFFRNNPSSIQLDMEGVNAGSTWFREWLPSLPLSDKAMKEAEQFLEGYAASCLGSDPLPDEIEQNISPDSILFPLQVQDDTQLFQLAGEWGNLPETLSRLVAALPEGFQLVVKGHPEKRGTAGLDEARACLRKQDVFIKSGINIHRLIQRCRAVVTINSTVGLEALVQGRPVLVLGRAAYAKDNLTLRYRPGDSLADLLAEVLEFQPDHDLRLAFFGDLKNRMFTYSGNVVSGLVSDSEYRQWADKILEIAGLPSDEPQTGRGFTKPADRLTRALREFILNKDYLRDELRGLLETLGAGPIHLIGFCDTAFLIAFLLQEMGVAGEFFEGDGTFHGRVVGGRKVRPLEGYKPAADGETVVICSDRQTAQLQQQKTELEEKYGFGRVYMLTDLYR